MLRLHPLRLPHCQTAVRVNQAVTPYCCSTGTGSCLAKTDCNTTKQADTLDTLVQQLREAPEPQLKKSTAAWGFDSQSRSHHTVMTHACHAGRASVVERGRGTESLRPCRWQALRRRPPLFPRTLLPLCVA